MPTYLKHKKMAGFLSVAIMVILACDISTSSPASVPGVEATTVALQLQGTALALQMTQAANAAQAQAQPQNPPAPAPQNPPAAVPQNSPVAPVQPVATPTAGVEDRIKSAKILVFENTDELNAGMIVQDALDGMGLKYTQTGSYSGHFMEDLGSGIKYDLIIADSEDHKSVTGEFWDVINTRVVRDKAALIVEMWYLNTEARGPISKVLGGCGIAYMKDWPSLDSIYWWEPTHDLFNKPNTVLPLVRWNQFWPSGAGDRVTLSSGGDATLLAGPNSTKSNDAVLATCNGGREVWQFFNDHDYPYSQMVPLWQNYIHYTLSNHFAVTP